MFLLPISRRGKRGHRNENSLIGCRLLTLTLTKKYNFIPTTANEKQQQQQQQQQPQQQQPPTTKKNHG